MALLSSLSLSLLRETPAKGKAEAKPSPTPKSVPKLLPTSKASVRPREVPKAVAVLPKVPEPKVQAAPKLSAAAGEADAKPKAISSLLGAYSDSEDEEEEQMKPGRLSTAAAAVVAAAGANKARAEAVKPPALKASQESRSVAPSGPPKPAVPLVPPAPVTTVTVATTATRAAAARHDGLARCRVSPACREVTQEGYLDMSRIDGEELSPEELAQVAHKCGPNAWRWCVREWRPAPRGQPLGSHPAPAPLAPEANSKVEADDEDPDFEDFAFFAGLSEVASRSEACELEVPQSQPSTSSSAPLNFRRAEEELAALQEEIRKDKEREEEERKWRQKQEERRRQEEEEVREKEKRRREDAIRQAEEERERRARRRRLEEEEKKRVEQERIETVRKRAEEIERRRKAEEEFLANAEAQKKASKAIELKAPSSLPAVPEGSLSALLRVTSSAEKPSEPEKRSRSPRRKPKAVKEAKEPPEEHPKEIPSNVGSAEEPVGWMHQNYPCSLCQKQVAASGGIFCGRRRDGAIKGCGAAVCWRCMNRSSKDEDFGKVRTNKAEFESLGEEAWWMHEACMEDADLQDYYDGDEGKFAWE